MVRCQCIENATKIRLALADICMDQSVSASIRAAIQTRLD